MDTGLCVSPASILILFYMKGKLWVCAHFLPCVLFLASHPYLPLSLLMNLLSTSIYSQVYYYFKASVSH